jgi:hypothetical protein
VDNALHLGASFPALISEAALLGMLLLGMKNISLTLGPGSLTAMVFIALCIIKERRDTSLRTSRLGLLSVPVLSVLFMYTMALLHWVMSFASWNLAYSSLLVSDIRLLMDAMTVLENLFFYAPTVILVTNVSQVGRHG